MRWLMVLGWLLFSPLAQAAGWPGLMPPPPQQGGGEKDAALVMGVEHYADVPPVPGAAQNARDWYAYLTLTRGIPAERVRLLVDRQVTRERILERAQEAAGQVQPGGLLWVVFIGHGAPERTGKDGLLIGYDAQQEASSLQARGVGQRQLQAVLAAGKQSQVVMVIDACFSGRGPTGAALVEGLQPLVPLIPPRWQQGTVLSAGAADQFAGPLPGVPRPAFSYLVLGALRGWGDRDQDGKVTTGEAVAYARQALSMLVEDRQQTPEVASGDSKLVLASQAREKGPDLVGLVLAGRGSPPAPSVEPTPEPGGGPKIKKSGVTRAVGDLTVDVKPREGARLELTSPSGQKVTSPAPYKNPEAEPGKWSLVARAPGHEAQTRQLVVPPDEATLEKVELKRLGGLKVEGKPAGAAVKVTGPGGFSDEGGLPWEAEGLASGTYRVEVSRAGYEKFSKEATVEPGRTSTLPVELYKEGQQSLTSCPRGMALVPGGSYRLGERDRESTVLDFCMDRTEVTAGAYAACVKAGKCNQEGLFCDLYATTYERPGRENHPLTCVTWHLAVAYCQAQGARLPSEEEWEWAARGGAKGWHYPWGNEPPGRQLCWNGEGNDQGKGRRQTTCPVGSYPAGANPQGIQDLAGNVWEWTTTVYGGDSRIHRGGSWVTSEPDKVRVTKVDFDRPSAPGRHLGFRCVWRP